MIIRIFEKDGTRDIETDAMTIDQLKNMFPLGHPEITKRTLKEQWLLARTVEDKIKVIAQALGLV